MNKMDSSTLYEKKPKKLRDVYQIKISLEGIRPPIWRRLKVFSDTIFEKLHLIIQIAPMAKGPVLPKMLAEPGVMLIFLKLFRMSNIQIMEIC